MCWLRSAGISGAWRDEIWLLAVLWERGRNIRVEPCGRRHY